MCLSENSDKSLLLVVEKLSEIPGCVKDLEATQWVKTDCSDEGTPGIVTGVCVVDTGMAPVRECQGVGASFLKILSVHFLFSPFCSY